MKSKILTMLRNNESYVSGQEICNELGVSRTAVWKCMNQLKEEGYTIEAISNKGYCLMDSPDILAEYEIKSRLGKQQLLDDILYFEEIDSTNNKAKQLGNEGDHRMLLLIAEEQTAGRGRRGRVWKSPKGTDIFMSFKLHPEIAPEHASMITLVTALSVTKAIRQVTGIEASIKWPNDIIVSGHKVCGILTEMSSESDYIHYVVVGIGINVNAKEFPPEIAEVATSLYREGKQKVNRASLVVATIHAFEQYYREFLETEDLSQLVDEYNKALVHKDKEVKIISGKDVTIGVANGISKDGGLLLTLEDQSQQKIISGEVSVRGINGYV